ncbi:MAG: hypothetical protein QXQ37_04890 [Nitrososphaerota archaeon]
MGKILAAIAKNEDYAKAIEACLNPYRANIFYSHKEIIKRLIERYKQVYGTPR